jgi:hypothetical protein
MDAATKQLLTDAIDRAFMDATGSVYRVFLDALATHQDEVLARQQCADGLGFCRTARAAMLKLLEELEK